MNVLTYIGIVKWLEIAKFKSVTNLTKNEQTNKRHKCYRLDWFKLQLWVLHKDKGRNTLKNFRAWNFLGLAKTLWEKKKSRENKGNTST